MKKYILIMLLFSFAYQGKAQVDFLEIVFPDKIVVNKAKSHFKQWFKKCRKDWNLHSVKKERFDLDVTDLYFDEIFDLSDEKMKEFIEKSKGESIYQYGFKYYGGEAILYFDIQGNLVDVERIQYVY